MIKRVYSGKTVLIEKKGAKYELGMDGKPLKEEEAAELYKTFNKSEDEPENDDFLPEKAVKVGDSWKVSAEKTEKMLKSLGEDKLKVDLKTSSAGGKLLKTYKKDGTAFGVLELTVTLFVTDIEAGGNFTKTKEGSKIVLKATIDTCIDGTVHLEEGKMEMKMTISAELANNGSLSIDGTITGIEKAHKAK